MRPKYNKFPHLFAVLTICPLLFYVLTYTPPEPNPVIITGYSYTPDEPDNSEFYDSMREEYLALLESEPNGMLRQAAFFSWEGSKLFSVLSFYEEFFLRIYLGDSPVEDFTNIFNNGTLDAKCYALIALRELDPKKYHELKSTLRESNDSISIFHLSHPIQESIESILTAIDDGMFSRLSDGQHLASFRR